jgi:hypothetical protein
MTKDKRHPASRASFTDRIVLRLCKSRSVDGLWIGTLKGADAEPKLCRVEEALGIIRRYDPLQYMRVINNLDHVWVDLVPISRAYFRRSLNACVLDERYVLAAATTSEMLARTIVHEATHARLDHWGVKYDEKDRARIEAVCMRRELAFAAKLPQGRSLQDEVERKIEWYASHPEYFSNVSFRQNDTEGRIEALRYLGAPEWLIRGLMKINAGISVVRQIVHRVARPAQ